MLVLTPQVVAFAVIGTVIHGTTTTTMGEPMPITGATYYVGCGYTAHFYSSVNTIYNKTGLVFGSTSNIYSSSSAVYKAALDKYYN